MKIMCDAVKINPARSESIEVEIVNFHGVEADSQELSMLIGPYSSGEIFEKLRGEIVSFIVQDNELFNEVLDHHNDEMNYAREAR
jgi:hypothetical protein